MFVPESSALRDEFQCALGWEPTEGPRGSLFKRMLIDTSGRLVATREECAKLRVDLKLAQDRFDLAVAEHHHCWELCEQYEADAHGLPRT